MQTRPGLASGLFYYGSRFVDEYFTRKPHPPRFLSVHLVYDFLYLDLVAQFLEQFTHLAIIAPKLQTHFTIAANSALWKSVAIHKNPRSKTPAGSASVSSQFHRQPHDCFQVSTNTCLWNALSVKTAFKAAELGVDGTLKLLEPSATHGHSGLMPIFQKAVSPYFGDTSKISKSSNFGAEERQVTDTRLYRFLARGNAHGFRATNK